MAGLRSKGWPKAKESRRSPDQRMHQGLGMAATYVLSLALLQNARPRKAPWFLQQCDAVIERRRRECANGTFRRGDWHRKGPLLGGKRTKSPRGGIDEIDPFRTSTGASRPVLNPAASPFQRPRF